MRITLISDIHLGVKQNNESFLKNTKLFFKNDLCDVIKKENSEMLFILGDLFDNRETTNVLVKHTALEIIENLLTTFSNLKIKLLTGNHDIYYKNTLEVSSLNIFKKFDSRLEIISQIKQFDFDGVKTLAVPWLIEGSKNETLFNNIITKCNSENKKYFNLCLGHFNINGFEIIHGVTEDKGLNPSDFKVFDYVFSGHFHIRNKIGNIQYLGSPYEITWNDWKDIKGIHVFDTETKETRFYENTTSPKHVVITSSKIESINDIKQISKNNFIKLIIDKPIKPEMRIELLNIIENNSTSLELLDESNNISIDEDIEIDIEDIASPMSLINAYCGEIKDKPTNIDLNKGKLYIETIYQKVIKEENA